jgi:hypothetical protein
MVQEPAHLLDRLPDIPPELGARVAEDEHARSRQPGLLEVPMEIPVEGVPLVRPPGLPAED